MKAASDKRMAQTQVMNGTGPIKRYRNNKAQAIETQVDKTWWPALIGLSLMSVVTPGVVIKQAQNGQRPQPLSNISLDELRSSYQRVDREYCAIGDDQGSSFSIAQHNRARALARVASSDQYVSALDIQPASAAPLPVAKPRRFSLDGIARTAIAETEKVIEATKKASKKIYEGITKRTVSGNGGRMILEPRTARMFAELERQWGERLAVRWAYRDPKLNKKVGGKSHSFHLKKMALDVVHGGWSKDKIRRFVRLAYKVGFRGFGMGGNVIHIDTRSKLTSWNYGGNRYGLAYSMVK